MQAKPSLDSPDGVHVPKNGVIQLRGYVVLVFRLLKEAEIAAMAFYDPFQRVVLIRLAVPDAPNGATCPTAKKLHHLVAGDFQCLDTTHA